MLTTIKYGHLTLDCDYYQEPADRSVGYYGYIELYGVFHAGQDITELLSDKAIEAIEDMIFEQVGEL